MWLIWFLIYTGAIYAQLDLERHDSLSILYTIEALGLYVTHG